MRAEKGRFAKRYAKALFELAAPDRLELFERPLREFAALWNADKALREALGNPAIPPGSRIDALRAIARQFSSEPEFASFLALLLENNRLPAIEIVTAHYIELVREFKKIVSIEITSAKPLDEDERRRIADRITAQVPGGRAATLSIDWLVDPSLIGGLRIKLGDKLLDHSLSGLLARLQEEMAA